MRVIAIEEHFLADGFRAEMQSRSARQGGANAGNMDERQTRLADLGALRLQEMDGAGIDLQVISHTAEDVGSLSGEKGQQLTRQANDQLAAAIAAHPDRFVGFAALPMAEPERAAEELERAVRSLDLKGAMIHGTTNGRFLDDPLFWPLLEQAAELQVPLYVHPGVPPTAVREAYYTGFEPAVNFVLSTSAWGWHAEVGIHALRLILAGVFDRLPTLNIIIGHMGEMLPFMLARIQNTLTPVARQLQRPVPEYLLHNFFITTSGFFTDPPLLLALDVMGVDRLLFAVDYPYSTNEQGRDFLEHASISPADKEKISHLNAERLLKLAQA